MIRRILPSLRFSAKLCVIPRHKPTPSFPLPLSSQTRRVSSTSGTRDESSTSGIIKLVEHELETGQSNFATKQRLEAAFRDLRTCLEDRADLERMVEDSATEKEMLDLAKLDLEALDENIENLIDTLTDLLIPDAEYDAENAVLEVNGLINLLQAMLC